MSNRHSLASFPLIGTVYVNRDFSLEDEQPIEYIYTGVEEVEESEVGFASFWSFATVEGYSLHLPTTISIEEYGLVAKD